MRQAKLRCDERTNKIGISAQLLSCPHTEGQVKLRDLVLLIVALSSKLPLAVDLEVSKARETGKGAIEMLASLVARILLVFTNGGYDMIDLIGD